MEQKLTIKKELVYITCEHPRDDRYDFIHYTSGKHFILCEYCSNRMTDLLDNKKLAFRMLWRFVNELEDKV